LEGGSQGEIFAQQIAAFEATHPGLVVQVLHKKSKGKGGILDFLSGASTVAPAVVPDLIVVDTEDLPELARRKLVFPLDGLLPEALQADLYPVAVEAGTVDGRLVGVQFEATIEHAVYKTSKIAVPPLTWTEVFSSGATYIFPTAGREGLVNDAFLIQYLSTGAGLLDEDGNPVLDQQVLTDVLEFYRQGIESGAILTDVLDYATVENCWPKYLQAEVVISNISSKLFMTGRGLLTVDLPTTIPTRGGRVISLSGGYAWALTAPDPSRQSLAVKLLTWLLHPVNMAAWSQASGRLPTRRAAFEEMGRDPYAKFLQEQMEYTIPYPSVKTHKDIYEAMQQAVDAVLREGVSPDIAAGNVLQAVDQRTFP
jgi:ABC-type glycerol-3-phosphate transport system substrate-binding protein